MSRYPDRPKRPKQGSALVQGENPALGRTPVSNETGETERDAVRHRRLRGIAAGGRAVLLVRHDRKSGGDIGDSGRGSNALTGAVDIVLNLARMESPQARPELRSSEIRRIGAGKRGDPFRYWQGGESSFLTMPSRHDQNGGEVAL